MIIFPEKNEMAGLVSAIVVTYHAGDYLKACLDSLKGQSYPLTEVILINNSASYDFYSQIKEILPGIKIYSSPENLFYCGALNKGIGLSTGEFILCLNDDVVLEKNFIKEAMRAFEIDERIGMASGKILRSDGRILDSTGLSLSIWRTPRERGYGRMDCGQYEKVQYIFGVNGAVAFYRRKMLEAIKINSDYFDADYRIFYEDLDIAWRAQNCGWKAYYLPSAIAYHARGATARIGSGAGKPYARRYLADNLHVDLLKNRYLTLIKNESLSGFLAHLPFILFYDILIWIYILVFNPRLIRKFILYTNYLRRGVVKRRMLKESRLKIYRAKGRFTVGG